MSEGKAYCRYHCRMCDLHFTSLEAFDRHIGPPGHHREPPERKQLQVRSRDATCLNGAGGVEGVVLWEDARQVARGYRAKGRSAPQEASRGAKGPGHAKRGGRP